MNAEKKDLEQRMTELENSVNDLFFSLLGYKVRKPILEEIVEMAVLQHFNVPRIDFLGKVFIKDGRPFNPGPGEEKNIADARKWFLSIMRYVLRKTTYSVSVNYPFYHSTKVNKHRPEFMAALDPMTVRDHRNREILLEITATVKRICLQEGILCEEFDYL